VVSIYICVLGEILTVEAFSNMIIHVRFVIMEDRTGTQVSDPKSVNTLLYLSTSQVLKTTTFQLLCGCRHSI